MIEYLKQKKFFSTLCLVSLFVLFFLSVKPAQAGVTETAVSVFGSIIGVMVSIFGELLLVVINVLIVVAQFNNFIGAPPVVTGWIIVRDLCNMFFVLILLVIAFATILHIPGYGIKQLFKRVIVFAILINFSKLICGLLIDFSQVIMLTFVNAFKDIGGGNISMLLGVDQLLALRTDDLAQMTYWKVVGSYALAFWYVLIMLVVMVALLATLAYRIVMLWIYIILSPMAYLASVVPFMSKASSQWWDQFTKQLVTGPMLAFFIWLSLATLGQFSSGTNADWSKNMGFDDPKDRDYLRFERPNAGVTEIGTTDHMLRFVISLGLLIGGLIVSKSFGGVAGGAIGAVVKGSKKGAGWMKKRVVKPAGKYIGRKSWQGAKAVGRGGLGLAKTVDYAASRKLAERKRTFEDHEGNEFKMRVPYGHEQGFLSRGAAWTKENMMSKAGWKKNLSGATRAVGWETDRTINQQRAAAKASGYYRQGGVKYEKQADGSYMSKNGQFWRDPSGNRVRAYSDLGSKLHQNVHGTKATTGIDNARVAEDKAKLEELAKPYKDMSKEELWSLAGGTADNNKLKGMYMALASEGGFKNQDMFAKANNIFAEGQNPRQHNDFLVETQKKQADLVFDPTDKDNREAFSNLIKKGKIKLEEQNLSTLDKDKPADMDRLADLMDVFRDSLHKERWFSTISKLDKEGDPNVVSKMAEALGKLSDKKELSRDGARADLGNILNDINGHRTQASSLPDGPAKEAHLRAIEDLTAQAQAKRNEVNKHDANTMSVRADRLMLDLNGDATKSFTNRQGVFDESMFKNYISKASVKQLSQINPDTVNSEAAQRAMAEGITYDKLKGLQKSGNNPDLVRNIAQAMADSNHPEADKIMYNIANDIDVDIDASKDNKSIQKLMRKLNISDADNLTKINEFRRAGLAVDEPTMRKYFT